VIALVDANNGWAVGNGSVWKLENGNLILMRINGFWF